MRLELAAAWSSTTVRHTAHEGMLTDCSRLIAALRNLDLVLTLETLTNGSKKFQGLYSGCILSVDINDDRWSVFSF